MRYYPVVNISNQLPAGFYNLKISDISNKGYFTINSQNRHIHVYSYVTFKLRPINNGFRPIGNPYRLRHTRNFQPKIPLIWNIAFFLFNKVKMHSSTFTVD